MTLMKRFLFHKIEYKSTNKDNKDNTVSLCCSSNQVLNKVIDDSTIVLGGLKFPQGNINCRSNWKSQLTLLCNACLAIKETMPIAITAASIKGLEEFFKLQLNCY